MKVLDCVNEVKRLASGCLEAWEKAEAAVKDGDKAAAFLLGNERNDVFCLLEQINYDTGQAFVKAIEAGKRGEAVDAAAAAYTDWLSTVVGYRLSRGMETEVVVMP